MVMQDMHVILVTHSTEGERMEEIKLVYYQEFCQFAGDIVSPG
jgi:hypothetical protein